MPVSRKHGVVERLNKKGLAVVKEQQSGERFVFTFDKIKRYGGQTARELGLQEGSEVEFDEEHHVVSQVEIAKESS